MEAAETLQTSIRHILNNPNSSLSNRELYKLLANDLGMPVTSDGFDHFQGKCAFSDAKRQLISLPSRLGGLGITDPCVSSAFQFDASQRVTGPLVSLLLEQDSQFTIEILNEQLALRHMAVGSNFLLERPCWLCQE